MIFLVGLVTGFLNGWVGLALLIDRYGGPTI
jgi:hypothetical protein